MSKHWPAVTLGEVLHPVERGETPQAGKLYRQLGVRLWGEGAYARETIDGSQTQYSTFTRVESDDVVVNKIWARNGSVAVVREELAGYYVSTEFPTFAPRPDRLEPRWMHWLTKTPGFWQQCDERARGTSGKNRIRPEQFLQVEIPLPALTEQRRIVARIEQLAAQIEEARRLRHHATEEAGALIGSERARVFEKIPARDNKHFEDVAVLERGKFSHRPRNEPRFFGGDHPWIQIGEIEASDKFIRTHTETLNDDGLAISRKFPKGTLLVSIAATIGAVGILNFDCCVPDSIVAITPKPGLDSEYTYHYLGYVRSHLERVAPQSAQKNINLRILTELPVPVPPMPEQRRIVGYLDGLAGQVAALARLQSETAAELDALLPSILDKAFKGEL